MKYDERHGGPFDRGSADFWYGRGHKPHYYSGDTYKSDRVEREDMTPEELDAYSAGYRAAEKDGAQKDWGYE